MWKIASIFLITVALITGVGICIHSTPTSSNLEIRTGYFELTVSPTEVCANIGERIEIRCTIECLVNTVVEIDSVDVLLFDSHDSMIRQQAMTKDSYWSFHTGYTIIGDEAYYQLKGNFTFPLGESGVYAEYGVHSFPIVVET